MADDCEGFKTPQWNTCIFNTLMSTLSNNNEIFLIYLQSLIVFIFTFIFTPHGWAGTLFQSSYPIYILANMSMRLFRHL